MSSNTLLPSAYGFTNFITQGTAILRGIIPRATIAFTSLQGTCFAYTEDKTFPIYIRLT